VIENEGRKKVRIRTQSSDTVNAWNRKWKPVIHCMWNQRKFSWIQDPESTSDSAKKSERRWTFGRSSSWGGFMRSWNEIPDSEKPLLHSFIRWVDARLCRRLVSISWSFGQKRALLMFSCLDETENRVVVVTLAMDREFHFSHQIPDLVQWWTRRSGNWEIDGAIPIPRRGCWSCDNWIVSLSHQRHESIIENNCNVFLIFFLSTSLSPKQFLPNGWLSQMMFQPQKATLWESTARPPDFRSRKPHGRSQSVSDN
jgi:hypothetical protein